MVIYALTELNLIESRIGIRPTPMLIFKLKVIILYDFYREYFY